MELKAMKNDFFINNNIRINPNISSPKRQSLQQSQGSSFSDIFNQEIGKENELKFSRHALERLNDRKINFSAEKMDKLTDAVDKASAKGARESLILMEDLALVVSIKNRTVITAVDGNSLKDNVFTNIDSAVII
jgi:flagellar operon protein